MLLRDYLRGHPAVAHRYADRKRAVAHLLSSDREAYAQAKSDVVKEILAKALEQHRNDPY